MMHTSRYLPERRDGTAVEALLPHDNGRPRPGGLGAWVAQCPRQFRKVLQIGRGSSAAHWWGAIEHPTVGSRSMPQVAVGCSQLNSLDHACITCVILTQTAVHYHPGGTKQAVWHHTKWMALWYHAVPHKAMRHGKMRDGKKWHCAVWTLTHGDAYSATQHHDATPCHHAPSCTMLCCNEEYHSIHFSRIAIPQHTMPKLSVQRHTVQQLGRSHGASTEPCSAASPSTAWETTTRAANKGRHAPPIPPFQCSS